MAVFVLKWIPEERCTGQARSFFTGTYAARLPQFSVESPALAALVPGSAPLPRASLVSTHWQLVALAAVSLASGRLCICFMSHFFFNCLFLSFSPLSQDFFSRL